ncbi:MAG: hypothetical protein JSW51_02935 [Gemmatimonadota bacterium]|nr:MAG: hypothetical protein JSW51_02935 [Gemmatimonadota bacterium]
MKRVSYLSLCVGLLVGSWGCSQDLTCEGGWCGTLVVVSHAEPEALLPPLATWDTHIAIDDLLFWKLADVGPDLNTYGEEGFQPRLAESWEFEDANTLVFKLNQQARWHDGVPVTAADVTFTYELYLDPAIVYQSRSRLSPIQSVTARDSLSVVFEFDRSYPEQLFDAVYHMRIMPRHILDTIPPAELATHPIVRHPIGNGPFKFVRWRAGDAIELAADSSFFGGRPGVRRIVWRFSDDPVNMVSQLVARETDFLSFVPGPENVARVADQDHLRVEEYKIGVYSFVGFNQRNPDNLDQPHPLFGDRRLRRALSMALDRQAITQSVLGEYGEVPVGPVTPVIWIWPDDIDQLPFDTAAARNEFAEIGWVDSDGDDILDRNGQPLSFDLIVPTSSTPRMRAAVIVQEQLRRIGVEMEVVELDPTTWNSRASAGDFNAYFQSLGHDASPGSVGEMWISAGIGGFNGVRYSNPEFDRLVAEAGATSDREAARQYWRDAFNIINGDAPAIWLFSPIGVAGVHARLENVSIPADEWWRHIWKWQVSGSQLIDRDLIAPN